MAITSRITLLGALALWAFQAQAVDVTVAYQTSAEPAKVAQADNTFAKESGANVDWRKFDSGAAVVRALASGDVQIGNIGSSPLAVAASQQVPIEVFLLASQLGNSEALVVKKNITKPEDLIGKRIAVPFISTTHYSLLAALKHWGIKPGQVQIINLQPPAIIAAWQRGDIDGAYVWAPAVNELEKDGTVLTDSEKVGQWGAPTLDVWVVRKDFAEKHPEIVKAFAKSAIDAQQPYISNPDAWLKQPANLEKLSRLSGVSQADVPGLVKGNTYLTPAQQVQQLTGPVNKAIVDTATFLKEQGKVPAVAADYSQYVTDRFVK
ncbi:taurine ABC transporter substrate-binding protein [Enterobacter cloacae]|uniref:taurine ABC transporter substrate-binding protein n=1 Tax=Enterobacter cloacae TaxID=550 RepID=UPI002AF990B2|nr:taurine ABC transporter substrate-binding protein [Enterobacter cloacae]